MGVRDYFVFNGVSSLDYNIVTSCAGTYKSPSVDVASEVKIPGRNGTLRIYNNRFDNVKVVYKCAIVSKLTDMKTALDDFRSFLMSSHGYCRLEDSEHPGEFRMAEYLGGLEPIVGVGNRVAGFSLKFDCMPQRYLKEGEITNTFLNSGTVYNPTKFDASPLIRVYGNGSLSIAGRTLVIQSNNSYIDIDCDLQECYNSSGSYNNKVTLSNGEFPVIPPGVQAVTIDGLDRVDLTARWWTL